MRRFRPEFLTRQPRALKEETDARNAEPHRQFYKTPEWRKLRAEILRMMPMCVTPGCTSKAIVVDHKVPHRGNVRLFFDRSNLQGMCKRCHDRKTATKDSDFAKRGARNA